MHIHVSLAAADVLQITAVAFELPPSSWCGTLKRLGTRPRWSPQPSAPDAGVQLEEYDSRLPNRLGRRRPQPGVSPARGSRPRATLLSQPPGAGQPATRRTCTHTRPPLLPHSDSRGAGRVSRKARRTAPGQPPQLDSNGVPSSSTASTQPILPAVGLGRGHELPVETPTLPVPTPRAPTRTGPAIPDIPLQPPRTRGSAPGTDPRALGPMRRPAMTDPGVPPFDPPGPTRGPRTSTGSTIRVLHPAYNAQPGRTSCL